jgi:hypothetical protein
MGYVGPEAAGLSGLPTPVAAQSVMNTASVVALVLQLAPPVLATL